MSSQERDGDVDTSWEIFLFPLFFLRLRVFFFLPVTHTHTLHEFSDKWGFRGRINILYISSKMLRLRERESHHIFLHSYDCEPSLYPSLSLSRNCGRHTYSSVIPVRRTQAASPRPVFLQWNWTRKFERISLWELYARCQPVLEIFIRSGKSRCSFFTSRSLSIVVELSDKSLREKRDVNHKFVDLWPYYPCSALIHTSLFSHLSLISALLC